MVNHVKTLQPVLVRAALVDVAKFITAEERSNPEIHPGGNAQNPHHKRVKEILINLGAIAIDFAEEHAIVQSLPEDNQAYAYFGLAFLRM